MTDMDNKRAYDRAYYKAHRERISAYYKTWRAANAEKVKADKAVYHVSNRERIAAKVKAWSDAHPGAANLRTAAWKAANPERKRELDHRSRAIRDSRPTCAHSSCLALGPVSIAWQTNPHVCYLCGQRLSMQARPDDPMHAHMDHVVPLSRGGLHCAENLRPACAPCNRRKGARLLDENLVEGDPYAVELAQRTGTP
jgi:5-methylcytosine-specific restriction endonuclease McrA